MGFDYLSSHREVEEDQNICVSGSDDSFVVDVERFSHVIQKKAVSLNFNSIGFILVENSN